MLKRILLVTALASPFALSGLALAQDGAAPAEKPAKKSAKKASRKHKKVKKDEGAPPAQ
ncbi:MAG: hypothetical protein ACYCWW_08455 [Deltaproteobacteria bacterium]